ncbi:MAG: class I SAM-dependent methyltransferase [Anaerolineales bacterium]|jgi:SAM-dependent methyltransferase
MTSTPSDLARLFHSQYAEFTEDISMWIDLAQRHGTPILELGCGTGRVLAHLAHAGHEVTGVDANPAMLERAQRQIPTSASDQVTLLRADLRNLAIPNRFPLAIAPLNVFAELDDDYLTQTLAVVRKHLTPKGVLALDLPNPTEALVLPENDDDLLQTFIEQETGHPVQVSAHHRLLPSIQSIVVTWHYDELLPNGMVSRHRFETTFHLRRPEILHRMLDETGYADVSFFGDYDFGALGEASKRLIVIAVNPT